MAKEVELPNSRTFGEHELHEMPSTLGVHSPMPHSPSPKVNPLHVIFNLNKILVTSIRANIKELHPPLLFSSLD
jgi:hypothetical protein